LRQGADRVRIAEGHKAYLKDNRKRYEKDTAPVA
jgi:hypothetical protein